MPYVKILFLPYMSAILPKGTRNIAAARRYAVATQPREMASIASSLPIDGSAMVMEEPIKGVRKEPSVATSRAAVLFWVSPTLVLSITTDSKNARLNFALRPVRPNLPNSSTNSR
ncbi:hypothetical protein ES703_91124 [subsurface metagenome]